MHQVGIKPAFRGKGLAKYLGNAVLKTLKERNVPYVSLTTGEARMGAVKSYLSAGFLPVSYANTEEMDRRWLRIIKAYGIDSIQMLNNDGTPCKILYAKDCDVDRLNVCDYGMWRNGRDDDGKALNVLLKAFGKLYLPAGDYFIKTKLSLISGADILCAPGAHIHLLAGAQTGRNDFLAENSDTVNGNENITINGGIWDGNCTEQDRGNDLFDKKATTGVLFNFRNVKNITLKNMTVSNPLTYYFRFCETDGAVIENIRFASTEICANQDGIHFAGCCKNFTIKNLTGDYGSPNDDFLAFNADDALYRQESFDVVNGPIENISVENVYSPACHCFVRLLSVDFPIKNVSIKNVYGTAKGCCVCMDAARGCRVPLFKDEDRPDGVGHIENVTLENFCVSQLTKEPTPFIGLNTNCEKFTVKNFNGITDIGSPAVVMDKITDHSFEFNGEKGEIKYGEAKTFTAEKI